MKFYNREKELAQLDEIRQRSFTHHSQMTVITGRRRIGKTKLILKSCEDTPTAYLFVSRNNEKTLCSLYTDALRTSLGVFVADGISSFVQLFEQVMALGMTRSFNLVIDEFQEFFNINPAVSSGMQDVWDRYKDTTHVNLLVSGSVNTYSYAPHFHGLQRAAVRQVRHHNAAEAVLYSRHAPNYKRFQPEAYRR